ncbi:MAG: DUF5053 domain-containing protein [Bacteroidales bacterium]|nr:DUF5053 domain-containing protein [Bacteroidales bacterium]
MAKGKYFGLELNNMDSYIQNRTECVKEKSGAVGVIFDELDGILNITKFSRRFFGKSHSWFSQRLHGSLVMRKEQSFKGEEYARIAEGFRELSAQFAQYADELDRAEND